MATELPRFTLPLPAETFLERHWQRRTLFMPAAASGLDYPDADTLAGLALEAEVESRLIRGAGEGPWSLQQGPLEEDAFEGLGERDWTLLVQSVDHFLTPVSLLLDDFGFVPGWRLEDIMISYAAEGGSVGPHFDQYDVFLIQASGHRHWKIGPHCDDAAPQRTDTPLKMLAHMPCEQEFHAGPGDVLYLPPGVAHHGVASDSDCVTWSVGFRAPDYRDLLAEMVAECLANQPEQLYRDAGRAPCPDPGRLEQNDLDNLLSASLGLLDRAQAARAVARWLSTPRQNGLDFIVDEEQIRAGAPDAALVRHGGVRLLRQGDHAWLNGECWTLDAEQAALVDLLAGQRRYRNDQLEPLLTRSAGELLNHWIDQGFFAPL
ncbi:cupin domain-containing protein [Alloalcanivorax xenomutans]|uniref:AraC family ligand binding domain-containing protein n=1 Tax=Alloalcanivorax xenomutans TaxID=1094342 RepID=A0A9Q3WA76_9GAMM|nr:cupin domain-containing protein [Alloalcanivorax xenomutans]ERS11773.1 cupin [Alcanivorax sp. PN-3]PHS67214.1 MAG: cupin domain-containing protein [Alcanivorax sp.]ARB45605.1 cupin [Alloalcanivorax xenomutans]MCE7511092.1 AraC family ligand binding domain-containing protein [Alloalcanivorax xenomutans]MCE7525862.1 AraC family ligand binding domain-containing protein [Alloalcanivorax xenomutans]